MLGGELKLRRHRCLRDWSLHRYTALLLSLACTHTHNHTPAAAHLSSLPPPSPPPLPPPPLTYFPALGWSDEVVGWMRSGSSISLYPCLPPSPPSSLCLSLCSAALQTLQTQSSQQAPLSASGLLVCEYANTAHVYVLTSESWVGVSEFWNVWTCDRVAVHTRCGVSVAAEILVCHDEPLAVTNLYASLPASPFWHTAMALISASL